MRRYQTSNYAKNKYKEGIVYHFQDGSRIEVSLEDYLKENPEKSKEDFLKLKEVSDGIYHEQVIEETQYARKTCSLGKTGETLSCSRPSLSAEYIKREDQEHALKAAKDLLERGGLTDIQKRRFVLHFIKGHSYREIARIEKVHFTAVQQSIAYCIKKLRKIYNGF